MSFVDPMIPGGDPEITTTLSPSHGETVLEEIVVDLVVHQVGVLHHLDERGAHAPGERPFGGGCWAPA